MSTAIAEVKTLLERLPESSQLEDIQYHLYVMEKIQRGLQRAEIEGSVSQEELNKDLVNGCCSPFGRMKLSTT